jgi:hypothetical protein
LEYLISGSLNVMYPLTSPRGELLGFVYAYECLWFTLILLPVYLAYLIAVPLEKFHDEKFANRVGIIYKDEVKTRT